MVLGNVSQRLELNAHEGYERLLVKTVWDV